MLTIEQMESTAKNDPVDGIANMKIRDHWLEVHYAEGSFKYKWGVNWVARENAVNVLASR